MDRSRRSRNRRLIAAAAWNHARHACAGTVALSETIFEGASERNAAKGSLGLRAEPEEIGQNLVVRTNEKDGAAIASSKLVSRALRLLS
jgi:hypothetical protein